MNLARRGRGAAPAWMRSVGVLGRSPRLPGVKTKTRSHKPARTQTGLCPSGTWSVKGLGEHQAGNKEVAAPSTVAAMKRLLPILCLLCLIAALRSSIAPTHGRETLAAGLVDLMAKAEEGDAAAQFEWAYRLANGEGVPEDDEEAVRWYQRAAEQGHPESVVNLGLSYANGHGVPMDLAQATRWYRLTAEMGYARAQFNLGLCHARGAGVPRDHVEAVRWYRLAAAQGLAHAQNNLGSCLAKGGGNRAGPRRGSRLVQRRRGQWRPPCGLEHDEALEGDDPGEAHPSAASRRVAARGARPAKGGAMSSCSELDLRIV